ncbi:MAG: site-2 protease family protein [Oscillospiraceae bacterium]|nr:site-2 protease family protein [Oscillospiraceae bacterium]
MTLTTADLLQYLTRIGIIFLILPLHEFAHAWAAHKLGDDTASYQGRMTLNPLAHVDPMGALLLLLTGFGWAKPVPIDPRKFNRKHSMRFGVAITALAGPLSNLLAALVGMIFFQFFTLSDLFQEYCQVYESNPNAMTSGAIIYIILYYFIMINIGLCVFNLIPIPPLDGSKILSYFTSGRFDRWLRQNQMIISIAFMVLIFTGLFSVPLGYLTTWVFNGLEYITRWIPAVFG